MTPAIKLNIPQGCTYKLKLDISNEIRSSGLVPEDLSYIDEIVSEFRAEYSGPILFRLSTETRSITIKDNSIILHIKPSMTTNLSSHVGVFDIKVYVKKHTLDEEVNCLLRGTFRLELEVTKYTS